MTISILVVAGLGLLALLSDAATEGAKGEGEVVAGWLAQGTLEELLAGSSRLRYPGTPLSGTFPAPADRYRFTVTTVPVDGEPRLTWVRVTVTPPHGIAVTLEGVRPTIPRDHAGAIPSRVDP